MSSHAVSCHPRRKLEDALDQKTAELITLRRTAMEHNSKAAVRDAALERAAEGLRSRDGGDWEIPASMGSGTTAAQAGPGAAAAAGPFAGPQPVALAPDSEYGGSESSSPLALTVPHGGSEFGGSTGTGPGAGVVDGLVLQLEEVRLQHGRELAEREARWRSQCEALQARLEAAQQAAQQQGQQQRHQQAAAGQGSASSAALAAQCDALSKERAALRTILDSKVGGGRGARSAAAAQVASYPQAAPHTCVPLSALPAFVGYVLPVRSVLLSWGIALAAESPPHLACRSACWWTTLGAAWPSFLSRCAAAVAEQQLGRWELCFISAIKSEHACSCRCM